MLYQMQKAAPQDQGIADFPYVEFAIRQKSQEPRFWEEIDFLVLQQSQVWQIQETFWNLVTRPLKTFGLKTKMW